MKGNGIINHKTYGNERKLIARGTTGMFGMMDMCYEHGWNYDNTIMEHDGDEWWIYEKIQQH